jgi:signal transduction histidine kinase
MSFCYFFAEMLGIPFILNKKKKFLLIVHMVLVVIATISVLIIDQSFLNIRATEDFDILNGPINILASMLMIGFFVYFMIKDNDDKEDAIIAINDIVVNKNEFLEKTNQELDHLVYSISHDLRAPISSALGLIELSKIENDIQQLHYYDGLKEMCLKRLDSFIFDILNYLKNNRLQLNIEKINLEEEVQFAIDMNKNSNEKIQINLNIEKQLSFYSDRNRLRIIFNNLISNAIRYSNDKAEQAKIDIASNYDEEEESLIIKIEDNGIGIDREYLPKIFDMFFKTDDKGKGSGLGLYITKEAVNKLNGTISVESEKGVGTIFTIVLPNLKSKMQPVE